MKQRTDTEKISQFLGRIRTGSSYLKPKLRSGMRGGGKMAAVDLVDIDGAGRAERRPRTE